MFLPGAIISERAILWSDTNCFRIREMNWRKLALLKRFVGRACTWIVLPKTTSLQKSSGR